MSEPSSPYGRLLTQRARQLIQALDRAGVAAKLKDNSLSTYSIKIDIAGTGALNLYYSPKKKRFRLGGHELTDAEIWPRITAHWDGDLGQPPMGTGTGRSRQKALIKTPDSEAAGPSAYAAYVDGSYMQGRIGYGAVILKSGKVVWETSGRVSREMAGMRQVGGELTAVMEVVRWCLAQGVDAIAVYYDYQGIAAWPTGRWRAKLPATQAYRDFIRNCGVALSWCKVKAHSGDTWNERADDLAKQGAAFADKTAAPPTDFAPAGEPAASQGKLETHGRGDSRDESPEDLADTPRFRFRDLHPDLYCGTASDRYGGWLGQIYPREKYAAQLQLRSKTVGGRTFNEQVLPVKSVRDYFRHFRILEIDFTFYQALLDAKGQPTRTHRTLKAYLGHLGPEDRLLLKVPQSVMAPELFRGKAPLSNDAYLDADLFAENFYAPAVEICGDHLWGFVFEQGYVIKARRQPSRQLALNLEKFFSRVPPDPRYHLELRTAPYLAPPLFEVLARCGVGQVYSHWTWLPDLMTQFLKGEEQFHSKARQVVVRLITPRGMRYADSYHKAQPFNQLVPGMLDETMLDHTADLVKAALDQAYTAALIVNNRAGGNAPMIAEALARRIRGILGASPAPSR